MSDKPEFVRLNTPERKRTYHFTGRSIEIANVVAVCVRLSGTHRTDAWTF